MLTTRLSCQHYLSYRLNTRIFQQACVSKTSYGYATMATDTSKYLLNHSMLRVKEPQRSLRYYQDIYGMKLIKKLPNPDAKFDLYFLAFDSPNALHHGRDWTDRQGILELTHNYGTEDSDWQANSGNSEPHKGFGHIAVSVDNLQAVCQKIEDAGYKFQKKLSDGRMRHIAFALDPDGYWVELISFNDINETEGVKETDQTTYRLNHSMIRIKDPEVSLKFYQETMGMKLLRTVENSSAAFNLYFLGYESPDEAPDSGSTASREGVLELTWNYGTEKGENDFKGYHNGNDEPQGFGHICVSVDDISAACERWEKLKVNWKKRLTDGRMKNIAFILDPDGYWIEVVGNERLKPTGAW